MEIHHCWPTNCCFLLSIWLRRKKKHIIIGIFVNQLTTPLLLWLLLVLGVVVDAAAVEVDVGGSCGRGNCGSGNSGVGVYGGAGN